MENSNNCMKSNRALNMEDLECKETDGKINPFYYINSKDIRAYLRSLNYEFSSSETAWLIWQSKNTSLDDRHRAWTKLIETMPDCPVEKRMDTIPRDSLHGFLKKLIEIENRFVNLFFETVMRLFILSAFTRAENISLKNVIPYIPIGQNVLTLLTNRPNLRIVLLSGNVG